MHAVLFLQGIFKHAASNDRRLVKKVQTKENKSKRPSFSSVLWLILGTWRRQLRPRGIFSHVCSEQQVFFKPHHNVFQTLTGWFLCLNPNQSLRQTKKTESKERQHFNLSVVLQELTLLYFDHLFPIQTSKTNFFNLFFFFLKVCSARCTQ